MSRAPRNLVIVLLAGCLIAGCGRVTQLPAQSSSLHVAANRSGTATVPLQQYTADDSVCRWSAAACTGGCGGGAGEEFIEPVANATDAVVSELVGDSPAFSPDGELVATVDGEQVRVWRAGDGRPEHELDGEEFVFSPDKRSLAVRQGQEWSLWDTTTWEQLYSLPDTIWSPYFSGDGRTIVAQGDDGSLRLYDAETGDKRQEFPDIAFQTAISPDGTLLATIRTKDAGAFDIDTIVLWDTATGAEERVLEAELQSELPLAGIRGHREISSIVFSPDGKALLSAGRDAVRLWDTATGEHLRCFQTPDHLGAAEAIWGADASTIIGKAAVTNDNWCTCDQSHEQDIYIWDVDTNHPGGMFGLGEAPVQAAVHLSYAAESGRLLGWREASVADMKDRKAFLWDAVSRQLLAVLPTTGLLTEATLSPAGERAVTVSMYSAPNSENSDASQNASETLLWDTNSDSLAPIAAAQESYWNALKAAVDRKPVTVQNRNLRKAKSLSPELFGGVTALSEEDTKAYGAYLERVGKVEAIADGAGPAAEAFDAEIADDSPQWLALSDQDLTQEVIDYIRHTWNSGGNVDNPGLLAAYEHFAALDPHTASAQEVSDALLQVAAPDTAAVARTGDVEGATAMFQETLSPYPDLAIDPEAAAQRIYTRVLCALSTAEVAVENADTLCKDITVNVGSVALAAPASGTLAGGTTDFWSFDAATAMDIAIDLTANEYGFNTQLNLFGPDGASIPLYVDLSENGLHTTVTLPQAGHYMLAVSSYSDSGSYGLTLSAAEAQG